MSVVAVATGATLESLLPEQVTQHCCVWYAPPNGSSTGFTLGCLLLCGDTFKIMRFSSMELEPQDYEVDELRPSGRHYGTVFVASPQEAHEYLKRLLGHHQQQCVNARSALQRAEGVLARFQELRPKLDL